VHATGSKLGDPIEVGALAKVYGEKRDRNRPLWLGTVKTNIGHLEPAAGIAGLIKVALSMKHGIIPRHLNCETPNPDIDWDALPVRVATESIDWPTSDDRPPRAGVSAFALSGTNAHLVVEGYAEAKTVSAPDSPRHFNAGSFVSVKASLPEAVEESPPTEKSRPRGTRLLPLSGKSGEALRELSGRYLCWLDGHSLEDYSDDTVESILSEMAWTASVGRDHFPYRAGVVFRDVESLRRELRALAESSGFSKPRPAGKTAFVFADGNTRRIGSDSEFCQAEPVMRSVLDYCDAIFRDEQGASLLDAMLNGSGNLDDPAWTYPAVYALDCAITALWSSIGVRPNAVLGTGPGEIAAAHAAGVFTLGDGLRLAARYGALVNESPGDTMPGSPDDILGKIVPALPSILLVNPVTARALGPGETLDSTYWSRHAHEPAAPDQALRTLAEFGTETVVGIGMSGKSVTELRSAWPALPDEESAVSDGTRPRVVLLQAEDPSDDTSSDRYSFAGAAAEIYEAGLPLDFTGLFAGEKRSRISVPGYPFQGRSFWFEAPG
ncbi:MAG: type I polyketide synthase, partial [Gammaproteobacteria bacterium]|nr:type I polyketide synthase [Gammaproteobacteria bacterium]